MALKRKQVSVKLPVWYRIRALADAQDISMGDVVAMIVDEWCTANGWRFTEVHRPGWPDKLTAKQEPAPAAGASEIAVFPGALG